MRALCGFESLKSSRLFKLKAYSGSPRQRGEMLFSLALFERLKADSSFQKETRKLFVDCKIARSVKPCRSCQLGRAGEKSYIE